MIFRPAPISSQDGSPQQVGAQDDVAEGVVVGDEVA